MKSTAAFAAAMAITHATLAQPAGQKAGLNAQQSDPARLGWMQGLPPARDKVISALDGSANKFPQLRYSFSHVREFMPTKVVHAAQKNRYDFDVALDANIDSLTFVPMFEKNGKTMTWRESLDKNYVDGVVVLHKGKVVYENYFGALRPEGTHIVMSVTKSFVGTLAAMLVHEGKLDENKPVTEYIPELKDSAWGDATVRQVMDMTTSLDYSENYDDPNAEIWKYTAAGSPFALLDKKQEQKSFYDFLKTVKKKDAHGKAFGYKTVNTEVLGWLVARASGKPLPQVLSEKIMQPLGAHHDAYFAIDSTGTANAGGGLNINLRDMAKFGEMMRNDGHFNGQQIVPKVVVDDIRKGADREHFSKGGYPNLKGWSYRSQWWVTHNPNGAFTARGIHGQVIYIDPKAQMVIVRQSSNPQSGNNYNDPWSLPAYQALADYLSKQ